MEKKKEYIVEIKEVHIHRVVVEAENEQEAKKLASSSSGLGSKEELEFDHSYGMDNWGVTELMPWVCEVAVATLDNRWETQFITLPGNVKESDLYDLAEKTVLGELAKKSQGISFVKTVYYRRAEEGEF
jgi:SRSO17 transposase